jgi:hypothetical protein
MKAALVNVLAAALALAGSAATGQDMLAEARASYANISGDWAPPGQSCADPSSTWRFRLEGVRAGPRLLDLIGIGGGPGVVRLDLVSRESGLRTPLAITQSGEALSVRGSGMSTVLLPCGTGGEAIARFDPPAPFGLAPPAGLTGTGPVYDESGILPPLTDEGGPAGAAPEAIFAADLTGAWSRGGAACDWRLGSDRIFADGAAYEVVNFSGSADRIGIQALREDGTPATFTVIRTGPSSASVQGRVVGGQEITAALTRC